MAILVSFGLGLGVHTLLEPRTIATAAALVVASASLWLAAGGIAWGVTRPLVELVSVTRDIGEGKLERRMRLRPFGGRGREVAVLAEAVNTMAERIEAQLAGQRELLAGVSHELRTPLGHLRVLVDTAREGRASPALFDELEHEVVELDALVDQLLVHSRLELGRVDARSLRPVELALRALERAGEDASCIEVETEAEAITGDPTLLGRALANLLANARGHGRGLDALRICDERRAGRAGLSFVVEDRGPGFAEDEREQVFGSFVQGRAREGGSLGLGLALVARIADAHSGSAWADNRAGGGARVGFWIPRDPQ